MEYRRNRKFYKHRKHSRNHDLGATPEYQLEGETSELCSGFYTYNLIDSNGCETSIEIEIDEPELLEATASSINPDEGENGSAEITVSGGTEPYDIDWGGEDEESLPIRSYPVLITVDNGCELEIQVDIVVSLFEFKNQDISVYPNPVTNYLNIETSLTNLHFDIFSMDGRLIESRRLDSFGIPFTHFSPGSYILKIYNSNFESHIRIVKK